jgi:hypothetical protein
MTLWWVMYEFFAFSISCMTYDFLLLSCHGRPVLAMHRVMLGTLKLALKHAAVCAVFYMNDDMSLGVVPLHLFSCLR